MYRGWWQSSEIPIPVVVLTMLQKSSKMRYGLIQTFPRMLRKNEYLTLVLRWIFRWCFVVIVLNLVCVCMHSFTCVQLEVRGQFQMLFLRVLTLLFFHTGCLIGSDLHQEGGASCAVNFRDPSASISRYSTPGITCACDQAWLIVRVLGNQIQFPLLLRQTPYHWAISPAPNAIYWDRLFWELWILPVSFFFSYLRIQECLGLNVCVLPWIHCNSSRVVMWATWEVMM